MLVFRLFRIGKNNQPSFKIVVTQKTNPARGGRFVEQIGFYNPITKEKVLNKERVKYWLSQGVKPSDTLYNLFIKEGILEGKKIPVHKKAKKPVAEVKPVEAKPQEAPKSQESSKSPAPTPVETTAGKPAEKLIEARPQSSEAPKTE